MHFPQKRNDVCDGSKCTKQLYRESAFHPAWRPGRVGLWSLRYVRWVGVRYLALPISHCGVRLSVRWCVELMNMNPFDITWYYSYKAACHDNVFCHCIYYSPTAVVELVCRRYRVGICSRIRWTEVPVQTAYHTARLHSHANARRK